MIDISLLTEAASGGSFGGYNSYTPAMEFTGDLDESTFLSARAAILTEAVGISEFCHQSEEILTEAVMNDLDRAVVISENAFDTVIQKIKKLIDKIIQVIKGLFNKVKAFFYTLTGKTDKWVKLIRPRAKAASQRKNKGEIEASMHEWNLDRIGKALDETKNYTNNIKNEDIAKIVADIANKANSDGTEMDADAIDKILIDEFEIADEEGTKVSDLSQETLKALLNDVWNAMSGGEKTTITKSIDSMINAVDGSKKLKSSLDKALTAAESAYQAAKKKLDNATTDFKKTDNVSKMYSDEMKKGESEDDTKKRINTTKNQIDMYNGYGRALKFEADFVTGIAQVAIKSIKTMCSEYMGAVNRFVGVRDAAANK